MKLLLLRKPDSRIAASTFTPVAISSAACCKHAYVSASRNGEQQPTPPRRWRCREIDRRISSGVVPAAFATSAMLGRTPRVLRRCSPTIVSTKSSDKNFNANPFRSAPIRNVDAAAARSIREQKGGAAEAGTIPLPSASEVNLPNLIVNLPNHSLVESNAKAKEALEQSWRGDIQITCAPCAPKYIETFQPRYADGESELPISCGEPMALRH